MKNNYLKHKFILSLSIAATLLSFSAISVLAQNQDPSEALIEQAGRKLKARLRSLKNGNIAHYLTVINLTPKQIKEFTSTLPNPNGLLITRSLIIV